jgi:hypothetical protein
MPYDGRETPFQPNLTLKSSGVSVGSSLCLVLENLFSIKLLLNVTLVICANNDILNIRLHSQCLEINT